MPPILPPAAQVQWVVPAAAPNVRQTAAEEEAGRRVGRELPHPEMLQPTLDGALPPFQPRCDRRLASNITVAVSDTMPALARLWIQAFGTHYPDVRIGMSPVYDGNVAARELLKGNADIAFVSRALKPDETAGFRSRFGYEVSSTVISAGTWRHFGFADAMGILVHKDNPIQVITYDQFDAIYSSTHHRGGAAITRWGQLGLTGEWADRPIHALGIKPWDGFEDLVRQRILTVDGKRGEWGDQVQHEGVFPMAQHIARDPAAIGYTGLAYIDADVRVLAIGEQTTGPFHAPTYEEVAAARYPLGRSVYAHFNAPLNAPPGKGLDPAIAEFLRFVLSREGQQVVRDQAVFLPLRSATADVSRSATSLTHANACGSPGDAR